MCTGGEFNFETMPGAPKFIPLDVVERHAGERESSRGPPNKRKHKDKEMAKINWKIPDRRRERERSINGHGDSGGASDGSDREREASALELKEDARAGARRKEAGFGWVLHACDRHLLGIPAPSDAAQDKPTLDSEIAAHANAVLHGTRARTLRRSEGSAEGESETHDGNEAESISSPSRFDRRRGGHSEGNGSQVRRAPGPDSSLAWKSRTTLENRPLSSFRNSCETEGQAEKSCGGGDDVRDCPQADPAVAGLYERMPDGGGGGSGSGVCAAAAADDVSVSKLHLRNKIGDSKMGVRREMNWGSEKKLGNQSGISLQQRRRRRESFGPLTAQQVLMFLIWQFFISGVVCNFTTQVQRQLLGDEPVVSRIAFGSCRNQSAPQPIWAAISEYDPEVFVWLGDNIYADSKLPVKFIGKRRTSGPWKNFPRFYQVSVEELEKMYAVGKSTPGYVALREKAQVIGTWDDHDYGLNDAGKELPLKDASQKLMLDFLDEPKGSPSNMGCLAAPAPGSRDYDGSRKEFLHRTHMALSGSESRYHRDPMFSNGAMLGEAQWAWLAEELSEGDAQITLMGSSIQVVSNMSAMTQPFFHVESWANFPKEQERMYSLIAKSNASGIIFLSGDVHFCEITRYDCGPMGYPLYDITSSGLTQAVEEVGNSVLAFVLRFCAWWMPNTMRVYSKKCRNRSCVYGKRNFGTIDIDWNADPVSVKMQVRDMSGTAVSGVEVPLAMLQPGALDAQPLRPGEIRRHCTLEVNLPWTRKYLLAYSFFSSLLVLMVTPCATGYFTVKMLRARRRREPNQKPD